MDFLLHTVLLGTGATALIDAWAILRKKLFGVPVLDYALVGRWFAYLLRGRFVHRPISTSRPARGERAIGWTAHYAIGICFAAAMPAFWGIEWARHPDIAPALTVGVISAAAPFLILQPGMGIGIAARLAPRPMASRLQTLVTHVFFGLGLYVTARFANLFCVF